MCVRVCEDQVGRYLAESKLMKDDRRHSPYNERLRANNISLVQCERLAASDFGGAKEARCADNLNAVAWAMAARGYGTVRCSRSE